MTPKKLIYQWVETFNRIDIDGLANMYHEDAINHQVNTDPLHGREAIRQMFTEEFSKANMICEIENVFESKGALPNEITVESFLTFKAIPGNVSKEQTSRLNSIMFFINQTAKNRLELTL